MHGVNVKTIKQNKDDDGNVTFEADDFNDEFSKFKEHRAEGNYHLLMKLKKYKAWYWGRSKLLEPKIIIKNPAVRR